MGCSCSSKVSPITNSPKGTAPQPPNHRQVTKSCDSNNVLRAPMVSIFPTGDFHWAAGTNSSSFTNSSSCSGEPNRSMTPSSLGDLSLTSIKSGHEDAHDFSLYRRVRHVGRGQFGSVYLVVHLPTGKLCALKELGKESANNNEGTTEIHYLEMCRGHPSIVQLEEVITEKGHVGIVTEFVDGVPWGSSDPKKRSGPIPSSPHCIRIVRNILRDILHALCHLHDTIGAAHMDIKSENILVDRGMWEDVTSSQHSSQRSQSSSYYKGTTTTLTEIGTHAKLIDMGSAHECDEDHPITSCSAGTFYYCAPEKLTTRSGSEYCPKKADIWALGVTTAVAVFGQSDVPFGPLDSKAALWRKLVRGRGEEHICLPQGGELAVCFPELMNMMRRMLCRDPKKRPSAVELLKHPFMVASESD
eukprot:PhF_6_TR25277/c1_g1_i2/m.34841